jgi:hypothetical protein
MTRCNGFCRDGRAIPARRTLAGGAAPSAGRRKHCCAAFVSIAARSTWSLSPKFKRSLAGTPTGTAEMTGQTWTFAEQTKPKPMPNQSR